MPPSPANLLSSGIELSARAMQTLSHLKRDERADRLSITFRVYEYFPSVPAAAAAAALYALVALGVSYRIVKNKHYWGLVLPISVIGVAFGYVVRILLRNNLDSRNLFILQNVFIACCPAGFLAFNYILYGRLIAECVGARHSIIRPQRVATFFILSDVFTFLIQAAGGSLITNVDLRTLGKNIFLVGIIAQAISYYFFVIMIAVTHIRVKRERVATGKEPWWRTLHVLYVSSAFIVIRSIYRLIEAAAGPGSAIGRHEVYIYVLDAIPLLLAVAGYVPWWPNKKTFADSIAQRDTYQLGNASQSAQYLQRK